MNGASRKAHADPPSLATQRATLRDLLEACRVVTRQQLLRWGLLDAAREWQLPYQSLSVRTRTTQPHSVVVLTFVALDPYWLRRPARDLMHWAAAAELYWCGAVPPGWTWQLVDGTGGRRGRVPDAQIICPNDSARDVAVEVDPGYSSAKVKAKLSAYAASGYGSVFWGVTVQGRVPRIIVVAQALQHTGVLAGMRIIAARYINFWTATDPYRGRPRCRKPVDSTLDLINMTIRERTASKGVGRVRRPD